MIRPIVWTCFFALLSLSVIVSAQITDKTELLWPLPKFFQSNLPTTKYAISPCQINFSQQSPLSAYINAIIDHYRQKVFTCPEKLEKKVTMSIVIRSAQFILPTETKHEEYSLIVRTSDRWELVADYYPGFVRGFETFSQLFEVNQQGVQYIKGLPILIDDKPDFVWRGLLIDTSRHFLPVQTIKTTIDALLYAKMNILHWHIVDEDAFPLQVPARPELSEYGKLSGTYTPSEVTEIVNYAQLRGIRVVPEIDTPAHSESWGRSEKYKTIVLKCDNLYKGQFDPTIPLTWQVLTDVLYYINSKFPDSYVHFGGDEVTYDCWDQRESIKEYMKSNNISDYFGLSVDFRKKQKKLWKESISGKKKVIYWANEEIDLPLEDDDVIQWWGVSQNVDRLKGRKNEVILSNYDLTYLDKGFGEYDGFFADFYYQNWRKMYNFQPRIDTVNVIGGQVCMWNEVGNQYTHQQKVVLRANILGERLWNEKIDVKEDLPNIASRLSNHAKRLRKRGLKVWPVTVGVCENEDMSICFH